MNILSHFSPSSVPLYTRRISHLIMLLRNKCIYLRESKSKSEVQLEKPKLRKSIAKPSRCIGTCLRNHRRHKAEQLCVDKNLSKHIQRRRYIGTSGGTGPHWIFGFFFLICKKYLRSFISISFLKD